MLSHFSHERYTFYHSSIDVTAINIFVKQVSSFCHPFIIYFLNINVRAQMSAIFTQGNRFAPLINKRTQRVGISLQLLRAWPIDVCNSCYCSSWRTLISSVLHPGIKWSDFSFLHPIRKILKHALVFATHFAINYIQNEYYYF